MNLAKGLILKWATGGKEGQLQSICNLAKYPPWMDKKNTDELQFQNGNCKKDIPEVEKHASFVPTAPPLQAFRINFFTFEGRWSF